MIMTESTDISLSFGHFNKIFWSTTEKN